MSLSSNTVDSQSLASENGGICLILSNLISCSSGDNFAAPEGDEGLDAGLKALAPVKVGEAVLDMIAEEEVHRRDPAPLKSLVHCVFSFDTLRQQLLSPEITNLLCRAPG